MKTREQIIEISEFIGDNGIEVDVMSNNNDIYFLYNTSDVFLWGCADSESIEYEDLPLLKDTYKELEELDGGRYEHQAGLLFSARKRKLRPQKPWYKHIPREIWHLFDACGTEEDQYLGYIDLDEYIKNDKKKMAQHDLKSYIKRALDIAADPIWTIPTTLTGNLINAQKVLNEMEM